MQIGTIGERLDDAGSPSIGFQIGPDATTFCGITRDALFDLAGYHRLRDTDEDLFRGLWPVIERLIRDKHRAGRGDASEKEMLITSVDILLYGFEAERSPRSPLSRQRRDPTKAGPASRLSRLLGML